MWLSAIFRLIIPIIFFHSGHVLETSSINPVEIKPDFMFAGVIAFCMFSGEHDKKSTRIFYLKGANKQHLFLLLVFSQFFVLKCLHAHHMLL